MGWFVTLRAPEKKTMDASSQLHRRTLTAEQAAAVDAAGNVLLMAGAGTGKTSTLVARVVARAVDGAPPVKLDRILMVTFTEAAAAEMRHRLREALAGLAEAAPEDERMADQLARLETAHIGTIHSFCLRLIREHFHELHLDPQLRVLEPAEAAQMFRETLDAVLDPFLGGEDAPSVAVQEWISGPLGGDLGSATEWVQRIHGYVQSRHDGAGWLAAQREHWAAVEPAEWLGQMRERLPRWAADWCDRLALVASANAKAAECRAILGPLAELAGRPDLADWREVASEALHGLLAADSEAGWKPLGRGAKTNLRPDVDGLMKDAVFLTSLVKPGAGGRDPVVEDWNLVRGHMAALVRLVEAFGEAFARVKRDLGVLDFADLEQFALRLLGDGTTPVARGCQARFEEVLVDEAQDLNPAQEAILRAVSRPGAAANRFLVGDVKQSIYRFRLADPRIFQSLARRWGGAGGSVDEGQVLNLTGNFRSHERVLDFANEVFRRILVEGVGGVGYGPDAELRFGAPTERTHFAGRDQARTEIHLRLTTRPASGEGGDGGSVDDAEPEDNTEAEARLVVRRLREMHDAGTPVWDRAAKTFRPMRWGDAVVLLRSPGPRGGAFARVFADAGVPLSAPPGAFFDQPEMRDLLGLLQVLDNPLQDIPLAGVLRSPLAGIGEPDELAAIRMAVRRERFWTALNRFHELGAATAAGSGQTAGASVDAAGESPGDAPQVPLEGEEVFTHAATHGVARATWPRVDRFLRRFAVWRRLAQRGSMAALLEAICDDTGYEEAVRNGPSGAQAVGNVARLLEIARRFDASQRGGLLRFLGHLRMQASAGVDAPVVTVGDAVRLMSIHASKGLEFPVVAVAGLGNRFNMGDLSREVVIDEERGLCPVVLAADGGRYPSWPLWCAVPAQRRALLGEELRLLYVALTRAAEWLLLFGTASVPGASKWEPSGGPLAPARVEAASSPMQWLGPVFLDLTGQSTWGVGCDGSNSLVRWRTWTGTLDAGSEGAAGAAAGGDVVEEPVRPPPSAPVEPAEVWTYPHLSATREAAKQSVTGLRRRASEASDDPDVSNRFRGVDAVFRLVRSTEEDAVRPIHAAERGTLHHRFQEHVDLARTGTREGLQGEVDRLVRAGRFTAAEAAALDVEALARFWMSPLGAAHREGAAGVLREMPFTLRLHPRDLDSIGLPHEPGLGADEYIVVQGVIDIVLRQRDGSVWVGDFKTDAVTESNVDEKAADYGPQLALYALALERILQCRVSRCWLHFLAIGATRDTRRRPRETDEIEVVG